ncbi:HRDC domain-containing protein [Corynebacterium heidelbergense]|uniref:Ribonuclease D n=1 Tax=Corynebacterium heidelbergense TaxID=2055947 RepID=A0A364VAS9_9CORY|nr:HRDC domain-containing protein [Corynebacterium heidelbergense]RAV33770.1 ribonuclease D [Corynebacterium heidelbergense]WCZ36658.1 Ribonuclease D [Corynebacterium heidelbergense]
MDFRLVSTPDQLAHAGAQLLDLGSGPLAVDTERAGTYRYNDRAFLIQVRRAGAGTFLIDPVDHPREVRALGARLAPIPWLLHAGQTDLPSLVEVGWTPTSFLDTQLAAALLGHRQLGLAGLVQWYTGTVLTKNRGQEDWSRRPLPEQWLRYAALDVEYLLPLHDILADQLQRANRWEWYLQECNHALHTHGHGLPEPQWQRMKGLSSLRSARSRAIARALFETRTRLARQADLPPEAVLHSKDIAYIAARPAESRERLREVLSRLSAQVGPPRLRQRNGRRRALLRRHGEELRRALATALTLPDDELPSFTGATPIAGTPAPDQQHGYPDIRTWDRDYPEAARCYTALTESLGHCAEHLDLDPALLLSTKDRRGIAWRWGQQWSAQTGPDAAWPAQSADPIGDVEELLGVLAQQRGVRPWQIDLILDATIPSVLA